MNCKSKIPEPIAFFDVASAVFDVTCVRSAEKTNHTYASPEKIFWNHHSRFHLLFRAEQGRIIASRCKRERIASTKNIDTALVSACFRRKIKLERSGMVLSKCFMQNIPILELFRFVNTSDIQKGASDIKKN